MICEGAWSCCASVEKKGLQLLEVSENWVAVMGLLLCVVNWVSSGAVDVWRCGEAGAMVLQAGAMGKQANRKKEEDATILLRRGCDGCR